MPHHHSIAFSYQQSQDRVVITQLPKRTSFFSLFQRKMAKRHSLGGYDEDRFKETVDPKLLCSVCLKVLKDPVQCPNEHYFCRSCVCKSLRENAEACPMCNHYLTEENLTKPPRILRELLDSLEICCDHKNRGCQEFIKLEFLDRHVNSCGYSLAPCTNTGCAQVMNQNEKERHEREQCEFRKIVCDECGEQVIWKSSRVHPCFMRKEMDELARRLNVVQNDVSDVKNDVREVKDEVKLTQQEMASITKEATERSEWFTGKQKIFICGGYNGKAVLNSVESYSWPENSWTLEPAMKGKRSGASAFVHGREIHVSGGGIGGMTTDSIESLNVDKEQCLEWVESPVKMPIKCREHKIVRHGNSAILTGGRDGDNVSDGIYEISPPHNTKLLTQLPEPRCFHGCEMVENHVLVTGGRTSKYLQDVKNTVYAYNLNNNECKSLPPLPFFVSEMATVSYKGNVVLIGGVTKKAQSLNSVVMYDVKTGRVKMLPCLNYKRAGSAAVITGNVIIVMGGYDYETDKCLNSVEYLDLGSNVWRELSPMKTKRSAATAVMKPIC